jgi:glycosyltransferase involved in cell wall biosynthesis
VDASSVTALILTRDEERNLPRALTSLPAGVRAFVLDAQSDDRTVEYATSAGATVETRAWTNFVDARRYALSKITTPWVLMLDADEALDDRLCESLNAASGDVDGYIVRRTTYFRGKPMRMWSEEPLLRLVRTSRARIEAVPATGGSGAVHERLVCDGRIGELDGTLLHYSYPDRASYLERYATYTAIEAQGLSPSVARAIGQSALVPVRFAKNLVVDGALLDGARGWFVAWYSLDSRPDKRIMTQLRIGLDARCGKRISVGMATYTREVSARLPAVAPRYDYRLYTKGQNLGIAEQIVLPFEMWRDRIDLAHYMAHYVPAFAEGRFVFTIHDLIHLRFVQFFRAYIGPYYNTVVKRACRKAARIITSDKRTIADLVHYFGVDPAKIRVIPLAPRDRFYTHVEPHSAQRPYFLNVGNHRTHKDIPTLLKAWASLPPQYDVDLYLTGADDFGGELQRLSTPKRKAIALGDVSDDELASYYAGAVALVHPAMLEGFGLPFVEALASGCPVIATDESIPEPIAGVSLTFAVGDWEAAAHHMQRMLDDASLRRDLVERGGSAVRALSWDRTARETAQVYDEVLGGN